MGLNQIGRGESMLIAIPAGGAKSGGSVPANSTVATPGVPILVGGDIVGVPESSFGAGTAGNMTLLLVGVFGNMLLHTGDTPAVGDKLYLDSADGYLTTSSGGNVFAGWAMSTASVVGANTIVSLRLKQG